MEGENTPIILIFTIKLIQKENDAFERAMPQSHMQF